MNQNLTDPAGRRLWPPLRRDDLDPNPFVQFGRWFDQALAAVQPDANAMTLATATPDGRPAARMVLLKDFDERGFRFFTNYNSRKGQELAQNEWAALLFWWGPLHRQVRIEGQVSRLSAAESDAYFAGRPRGSQLGAWASPQSQLLDSRAELEHRLAELEAQWSNQEVPRPPFWGGYRLEPTAFEFWQGGADRLHDRFRYTRQAGSNWQIERLFP